MLFIKLQLKRHVIDRTRGRRENKNLFYKKTYKKCAYSLAILL